MLDSQVACSLLANHVTRGVVVVLLQEMNGSRESQPGYIIPGDLRSR